MGRKRRAFRPRGIDRAVLFVLALLQSINTFYLISPWYSTKATVDAAPLYDLLDGSYLVATIGILFLIDGILLGWAALGRGGTFWYTMTTQYALLAGFLLRFYSLVGVALLPTALHPPFLVFHATVAVLLGAYWLWVGLNKW